MIRIDAQDFCNGLFRRFAAASKEVAHLILVEAKLCSEAAQRAISHPQLCFDLLRVQGH